MRGLTRETNRAVEFNRRFFPPSPLGDNDTLVVPDATASPLQRWQDLSAPDPSTPPTSMSEDLAGWYDDVRAALQAKPAADVARELPGLVDHLTGDDEADHYVVGVSFTKNDTCLDYAVERVTVDEDGQPHTETVKTPASGSHRYVQFTHPPDPQFDAAALRARLLGAVDRERRELANVEGTGSSLADLWERL